MKYYIEHATQKLVADEVVFEFFNLEYTEDNVMYGLSKAGCHIEDTKRVLEYISDINTEDYLRYSNVEGKLIFSIYLYRGEAGASAYISDYV